MLNILHITDFHFKNVRKEIIDQEQIVENLVNDLKVYQIDAIIFSGDLVFSGEDEKDFQDAQKLLLDRLAHELNICKSNIVICSGNHDMNRKERIDGVIKQLDKNVNNNDELESYLKSSDFDHSIKPMNNFFGFQKKFYDSVDSVRHIEKLFCVFEIEINSEKIGIVSINNSWRAVGLDDENKLLFPISKLKESLSYLTKDCVYKALVMHHPFSDLRKFNSYDIEEVIYNSFDILFSGHIHKKETEVNYTTKDGIIKIVSPATLSKEYGSQIGYTILGINSDDLLYEVINRYYDVKVDTFYGPEVKKIDIPTSVEKKESNKFRQKIKKKFDVELLRSNQLLISKVEESDESSFFHLTTEPVIKTKSIAEISSQDDVPPDFNWNNFKDDDTDYLVLGKGKCGKTVLLKKIQLEILQSFSTKDIIPFYLDIKDLESTNKDFNLIDEFRVYFELNKTDACKILETKKVLLLIDNYSTDNKYIEEIAKHTTQNQKIRIIACTEETIIKNIEDSKLNGRVLKKLYFHRLRKKHIKTLTKNLFKLNDEKQEEIVEKVNSVFSRLSIPFNFWSVSLFLWVFKNDFNKSFQNDVELINLYIEKLLEKEELTLSQSDFGFDKYKKYLSSLSYELLTRFHDHSYSMTYSELNKFTEDYLNENIRYTISSRDVLNYIENRGILMKKSDDRYTFRLKGVFEYFLANELTYNKDFVQEIINDNNLYLSFSNELELFAGFQRDNEHFLDKIYDKTKSIYSNLEKEYNIQKLKVDSMLNSKIIELNEMKPLIESITKSFEDGLSEEKRDAVEELILQEQGLNKESQSEVKKKEIQIIDESIESLEKSLYILGRVFKNIDEIKDNKKVNEVFDYIIDSSCLWGFKVIDEIKLNDITDLIKDANEDVAKKLLSMVTNFIPTLVQNRVNDMIGDKNLEQVINLKIEELKKDKANNQYKLFILYFLLLDINFGKNKNLVDEIREIITIPILRYSILLKLNFYLGFKTNKNDKEKVNFLRKKIQQQQIVYNEKSDIGILHQSLERRSKKKLKEK